MKFFFSNMHQKGNITSLMRELNDTRHVIIPTATDLVAHLGLCVGEAASYLGILNNGDCIAVCGCCNRVLD